MYRELMMQAPPELTVVAGLRKAPPAPWLAKDIHGKTIVALFVCYRAGGRGEKRSSRRSRSSAQPVGDIVQRRTYVSQQSLLDATQPKGRRYYWKSEYLPRHRSGCSLRAIEHAARSGSPHSAILFFPLGGPLDRLPADSLPRGQP